MCRRIAVRDGISTVRDTIPRLRQLNHQETPTRMRPAPAPIADHRPAKPWVFCAATRTERHRAATARRRLQRVLLAGALALIGLGGWALPLAAENAAPDPARVEHPERRSLEARKPAGVPKRNGSADPGIRLEVDRQNYRVVAVDLASGELGPSVQVATGSPEYATPTGQFRLWQIIRDPAWNPGPTAREFGADPVAPSPSGPLGVAKIPFDGAYALHGGANLYSVGKPITLGCLRSRDADLSALIVWLESRGALGPIGSAASGERPQPFVRPARLIIR